MGGSKLRKAIGAVKDRTSIGLAKVGTKASLSELDVAIVKATRHEEYPPDERYIHEIITLTAYSRTHVNVCIERIAKRLNKTKNWVVALKSLVLVQRLLSEGDRAYEQEIFFATRRGTRLLNMSDFRDASKNVDAWDYSAFVRTYALYLDEQLEFRMQGKRWRRGGGGFSNGEEEEEEGGGAMSCKVVAVKATSVREMSIDGVNNRVHHLMQILERFLACRPTGAAKLNRVVASALYPIVKESFQLHYDITEVLGTLTDRFMQLDPPEMVKVYEIFCRVSKQYDELDSFYCWCKSTGIGRFSEYPDIQKITDKKLDAMDDFIHRKIAMSQKRKTIEPPNDHPKPVVKEYSVINKEAERIKQDATTTAAKLALPRPPPDEVKEEKPDAVLVRARQVAGDLLNFGEEGIITEPSTHNGERDLALTLFEPNNHQPKDAATWEAFKDSGEWESALVVRSQAVLLDGMYQHGGAMTASTHQQQPTGNNNDPFYASLAIAPAPYVQMSDLEKQRLMLTQQQLFVWQQHDDYQNNNYGGFMRMQ